MSEYMLIQFSDDGNPIRFLTESGLQELLKDPLGTYGVERFLAGYVGTPAYWEVGSALLLRVEVLVPEPVVTVTSWEIP